MKRETGLILALDLTDREDALWVVSEVGELADAVKVNYPIILSCGIGIVRELAEMNDVICDLKVADVPNTNRLIIEQAVKAYASGVICQGFIGKDALEACVKAAEGIDVFVVAEMSHPDSDRFIQPQAEEIARLAVEVGATGIIAPGTRPERITILRNIIGDLKILAPGIGAQGGSASKAIEAGADYAIVGRAIYQAENPRAAAEAVVREISGD